MRCLRFPKAATATCAAALTLWVATPSAGSRAALAQHGTGGGEWPSYGGDTGSTHYSPLDRIDATNFARLAVAWRWQTADARLSKSEAGGDWIGPADAVFAALQKENPDRWRAGRPPMLQNLKATPLMVGGVLYLNTPISQGAAIDAATGRTLWVYNPKSYESGTTTMSVMWNQRGVAYWSESRAARRRRGADAARTAATDRAAPRRRACSGAPATAG